MNVLILISVIVMSGFQKDSPLREVSRWGFGPVLTVAYSHDTVLVGSGAGIFVLLDKGDDYELLNQITLANDVIDIKVHKGIVYVAEEDNGVECFKLRDGKLNSECHLKTDGKAYRLSFSGELLLVAMREGGLAIYKKGPFKKGPFGFSLKSTLLKGYEVTSAVMVKGLVIVGAADSGIFVFNYGDTIPVYSDNKLSDSVEDIDLINDSIIAITLWDGNVKFMRVKRRTRELIDMGNASYPYLSYHLVDAEKIDDSTLMAGGYRSDMWGGVVLKIDISNIGAHETPKIYEYSSAFIQAVKNRGNSVIYLACDYGGVKKVKMSGDSMITIWEFSTPGYTMATSLVNDTTLVLGDKMGNFLLLNIKDLNHIRQIKHYHIFNEIDDVTSYGGHFYLAAGSDGLIYSTLERMVADTPSVDTLYIDGILRHLTLDTARAMIYTADDWGGAHIVSINPPSKPSLIYSFDLKELNYSYISDIERHGSLFYMLTYQGRVIAYDKDQADSSHVVASTRIGSWAYDMSVRYPYIFIAADDSGLVVIKANDNKLDIVTRVKLKGYIRHTILIDHYLLMSGVAKDFQNGWLYVFDVSSPEKPELLQEIPLPGLGEGMTYLPEKGLVVVSAFNAGLIFYKLAVERN